MIENHLYFISENGLYESALVRRTKSTRGITGRKGFNTGASKTLEGLGEREVRESCQQIQEIHKSQELQETRADDLSGLLSRSR